MTRMLLAVPLLALLLLACGAQEDPGTAADTPAVESAPDAAALAVKACLDLVAAERYGDAVAACEAARDAAPASSAARSALERARAGSGG